MKEVSEVSEVREAGRIKSGSSVKFGAELTDWMASVASIIETQWTSGEQEVEPEDCCRSDRERRGRVTKPDSRPREKRRGRFNSTHKITFKRILQVNSFYQVIV